MSHAPRPTSTFSTATNASSIRQPSIGSSQQSSALAGRIAVKRAELENLKQLRDLSVALAGQMSALEERLATLRDGAEAVACVLANWDNVLRAISMASMKIPEPQMAENGLEARGIDEERPPLPFTLVRIPVEPNESSRHTRRNKSIHETM